MSACVQECYDRKGCARDAGCCCDRSNPCGEPVRTRDDHACPEDVEADRAAKRAIAEAAEPVSRGRVHQRSPLADARRKAKLRAQKRARRANR